MLATSLIGVMFTDKSHFATALAELREVRQKALALDPNNPRVVQIDAGIIFNDPSEPNGHERGIARLTLRLTPAQTEQARAAAETALRLPPDFWYVHQQVLPQLNEARCHSGRA